MCIFDKVYFSNVVDKVYLSNVGRVLHVIPLWWYWSYKTDNGLFLSNNKG